MKTMSESNEVFLEMQGVKLLEGDVWGHRKDIDEYFTVPDQALEAIKSMKKEGLASDNIAKEVQKTTKLGKELVKYLAKAEIAA
jgi:hypothetical protein